MQSARQEAETAVRYLIVALVVAARSVLTSRIGSLFGRVAGRQNA